MSNRIRSRRGFTLVEVMTTATLIAGLGGSTAFVNPKDKAQQLVCLQHLQVIGQTFQMQDLQGQPLPPACFFPKTPDAANSLPKLMGNAVQEQAWLCPCAPVKLREHKITYLYNSKLAGKQLSAIPDASHTWLLADLCVVSSNLPGMHNDGANILFADGQARWLSKAQLPDLTK